MSQNDQASGVPTLEEALAELEGLKEQLSGSDLKVFTQNRELRQETTKLREEVTRLAEECVTQTFTIRTLEKAKAALESTKAKLEQSKSELEQSKAELESQVVNLKLQVAELEGRVGDLTEQVGVHRSQEIHLSQELERTISANADELSRLRTEHDSELTSTRDHLEKVRVELEQDLTGQLKAKADEIENLERRVEQFKEEFLSQEVASPISALSPAVEQGKAFSLLRDKMEGLLGFPGRAMVEQVFRLCGADQATSDPAVLEEAFEALQDTAAKLVRSPEQERELSELLGLSWQELGLDARAFGSAQATPASIQEEAQVELQPEPNEVHAEPEVQADSSIEPTDPVGLVLETSSEEESLAEVTEEVAQPVEEPSALEQLLEGSEPEAESAVESAEPEALEIEVAESVVAEEAVESSLEQEPEPSLLESEAVTEEDMPAIEVAEESQEVVLDSIDQALAEPSVDDLELPSLGLEPEPELDLPPAVEPVVESESLELSSEASSEENAVVEESLDSVSGLIVEAEVLSEVEVPLEVASEPDAELPLELEVSAPDDAAPETDSAPASDDHSSLESESEEASQIDDSADAPAVDFDSAADALTGGDYELALSLFRQLRELSPDEPTYQVGEVSALAGLEHYDEAYALGRQLDPSSLGASEEIFLENFESVLVGRVELAETLVSRKLALIELIDFVRNPDRVNAYLDEVDEIGLRTPSEGRLSLLQAQARIEHDDVTEYLLEAMSSLDDKPEIFDLLRQNLERYPELSPLSELTHSLMESPRDEALEAEAPAQSLLVGEETLEELLAESDPDEEALIQAYLEHMLPRTGMKMELPSEAFEDLLQDSEPAAFVGALRQALRSVDYTLFFDEIEVLSYDGEEHFLLRSSPEPKATLLFGADVDDVPPEELRFLVLRELFSMQRKHSHLAHLAAQLDDRFRYGFVKACLEMHKEAKVEIPEELLAELGELEAFAIDGGQDSEFKSKLESALLRVYQATESDSILELDDFLYGGQLHKKWLDPLADSFAAKQTGLVVASYAIARDSLNSEEFEALEETGFSWLYLHENLDQYQALRLRLQRLWSMPFKALVSEAEE